MEWSGQRIALRKWAITPECHHLCIILLHVERLIGRRLPRLADETLCRFFIPKVALALGTKCGQFGLLSDQGDIIDRIDVDTRSARTPHLMAISPYDGSVAWAAQYVNCGKVFLQNPGHAAPIELSCRKVASRRELPSEDVDIFGIVFLARSSCLMLGMVDSADVACVWLHDYAKQSSVCSFELADFDPVDYVMGDIRSVEGEMSISNNELYFGACDGWNVMTWDFRTTQCLFKGGLQPVGLAFSPDSKILIVANYDFSCDVAGGGGTRLHSLEMPCGYKLPDHGMHLKFLHGTSLHSLFYSRLGLLAHLNDKMILINSDGEVLVNMKPFEHVRAVVTWADVAEFSTSCNTSHTRPYATVIQPIAHAEEPAVILAKEAAEIVAHQEAGLIEQANMQGSINTDEASEVFHQELRAEKKSYLCTFNRCTKELRESLCSGPQLKHIRDAMGNHKWLGPAGSLIFVEEEWFDDVMTHLGEVKLQPSHLVISEDELYLVDEAIDKFRKIWCKDSTSFVVCNSTCLPEQEGTLRTSSSVSWGSRAHEEDDKSVELRLYIENTFVVIRPSAALSKATESTTKAHCPNRANVRLPRQHL